MWTPGLRNLKGEVGRNMRAEYDGRLKVIEALLVSIMMKGCRGRENPGALALG